MRNDAGDVKDEGKFSPCLSLIFMARLISGMCNRVDSVLQNRILGTWYDNKYAFICYLLFYFL